MSDKYEWTLTIETGQKGGPGSGHHGHTGRPGQVGGSAPGKGESSVPAKADLPAQWQTIHHNDDGSINPQSLAGAVNQAVQERPSRATHGNTANNAFFIVDDKIYAWNEYRSIPGPQRKKAIPAHSHGGENWRQYEARTGKPEDFQPHNSEDVRLWLKELKRGDAASASVLIMPDGRMEVLELKPDTDPAIFRMGPKRLENAIDIKYGEAGDFLAQNPGSTTTDFQRQKLRRFVEKYNLGYHETNWRNGGR